MRTKTVLSLVLISAVRNSEDLAASANHFTAPLDARLANDPFATTIADAAVSPWSTVRRSKASSLFPIVALSGWLLRDPRYVSNRQCLRSSATLLAGKQIAKAQKYSRARRTAPNLFSCGRMRLRQVGTLWLG